MDDPLKENDKKWGWNIFLLFSSRRRFFRWEGKTWDFSFSELFSSPLTIYAYTHTHTRKQTHTRAHTYTHEHTHTDTNTQSHTLTRNQTHTHTQTHAHAYTRTQSHTFGMFFSPPNSLLHQTPTCLLPHEPRECFFPLSSASSNPHPTPLFPSSDIQPLRATCAKAVASPRKKGGPAPLIWIFKWAGWYLGRTGLASWDRERKWKWNEDLFFIEKLKLKLKAITSVIEWWSFERKCYWKGSHLG